MHKVNKFGSYTMSFLCIKIETEHCLCLISNLDKDLQRTFFHENIHFLQNLTSAFGHTHIWKHYDEARQMIISLQDDLNELKRWRIPIQNQVTEHFIILEKILRAIEGTYRTPREIDDTTAEVVSFNLYSDENYESLHAHGRPLFVNLILEDKDQRRAQYHFGESAISETMAYLLERKLFGEKKLNSFPYEACQKLCDHLGADIHRNEEMLFTLCDVSLMTNYPGYTFLQLVSNISQYDVKFNSAENLFDYSCKYIYNDGWKLWDDFEHATKGSIAAIQEVFKHEIFTDTLSWVIHLLSAGYWLRVEDPYFMIRLYREQSGFEGEWIRMNQRFGTPQLINSLSHRFLSPPTEPKDKKESIEPFWLLALQEVTKTLVYGSFDCKLYESCGPYNVAKDVALCANCQRDNRPEKKDITNYDCKTAPWLRADQEPLCAYGALWKVFNLVTDIEYGPQ